MNRLLKNFLCFFFGCIIAFSFALKAEAYTTVDLGNSAYGTTILATDKNGVIWSAGITYVAAQGSYFLNIYSSNGNSGLSTVASHKLDLSSWWYGSVSGFAVDGNNSKWVSVNFQRDGNYRRYVFEYNGTFIQRDYGTTSEAFGVLGVDPEGKIWSLRGDSAIRQWNGGWIGKPSPGWSVKGFISDYQSNFWIYGYSGQTAVWNGSSWTDKGTLPFSNPKLMVNPGTGNMAAFGSSSVYEHSGSSWVYKSSASNGLYGGCFSPDGYVVNGYYYSSPGGDRTIYHIDTVLLGDGSIYIIQRDEELFCSEGCSLTVNYTAKKYVFNMSSFSLTPSPDGPTGQLRLIGQFDGRSVGGATVQYSTNGSDFSDLRMMQNGDAGTITPAANTCWFRLRWFHRYHPVNPVNTFYTNAQSVPTISISPSISNTTGIAQWDAARGRSWVRLSWGSTTNATGYNLQIFDGNVYRVKNIGNVTSWDSRTAKVFPPASNLPENNTVSSDLFRWDASGMDFEDTAVRLYRSTVGTGYDNIRGYYFRVSAYNAWMESTPALIYIELPNATDSVPPSGTISVTVPEGATAPATVTVNLSAVVDNSGGSGLYQMRFSNDNAAWSGWENFAVSKSWTTSTGEGQKTVYAQVKDNVGNTTTFSVSFWLGATLTQIYNEAQNSNQKAEAARQAAVDAKNSADAAKAAAQTASTNSSLAASNAQTAADRSIYTGKYGGSTESVADLSGYMRYNQLPAISDKADSIQNSVNTINNTVNSINTTLSADTTPPAVSVRTLSGALATSGGTITLIVSASDNRSSLFTCSVNGGPYQDLPADGLITVPVGSPGPNAITVRVRDGVGNTGAATIVIRKL